MKTQAKAQSKTQAQIVEATKQYLIPNYWRLPIAMVRGQGSRIWDADGKEYLDFFAGFGLGGVAGHCHPQITAVVVQQAQTLTACGNYFTNEPQVELAAAIAEHGFGGKVFFCHSGAEANEAALKLARAAAGAGRYKIVSFHNCFHGRTMGALSLTPEKFQKGFEPMVPGNVKADLNDLASVEAAVDAQTAGVIVEPIQGEGGMNMPTPAFMQGLRALCDQKKILLIVDEVWTAPARTGKWFAYQHYGIVPDAMTLGKAIGGGLPVGACVAAPKWADVLQPGSHGCTGGGNPLCSAAGAAAMRLIASEDLVGRSARKGAEIMDAVRRAQLPVVRNVRGFGLMIGIELTRPGKDVFTTCLQRGLFINCTQDTVLRLAPPLTTPDEDLAKGLDILLDVLKK
jgi:acetylornithine/N-succinyldiaminopimelate aminotransferase